MKTGKPLSYERKKSFVGYAFIGLWLFGFIYLCLIPLGKSLIYSFSTVKVENGFLNITFSGVKNYRRALLEDAEFLPALVSTLGTVVAKTPIIIIFSILIAVMLNQEFRGRALVRSIFFIPVIITGSVVMNIISSGSMFEMVKNGGLNNGGLFQTNAVMDLLQNSGLNGDIVNLVNTLVNDIFNYTWSSGIQILIFLAALQSVDTALYEVAKVEGATAWETFWRVTFPMIMPMLIINVLYTIVDNFINYTEPVFKLIQRYADNINIDYAAAMSWMCFIIIFVIVIIVYSISNRKTFYVS